MPNKNNKKQYLIIAVATLLVIAIGFTAAYFQAQIGNGANANVTVTTKTTDVLTFSKGNDISITATQANFGSGAGNRTGSTTATATLLANNDTNSATNTYNVYLYIQANNFEYCQLDPGPIILKNNPKINNNLSNLVNYSNTSDSSIKRLVDNYCDTQSPELMLTITNPNNQAVTSLTGLTYTTSGGVSGFDITAKKGLIQIASNYTITSTGTKTDTWNITVTLVNLNSDQQYNTGKTFTGQIIIQKEEIPSYYWNDNFGGTYAYSYPLGEKSTDGVNWTSGSPTTYPTLAQLQSNYANFSTNSVYIKTIMEHQACLYYNNHEFCLGANYWEGTIGVDDSAAGLATKNKLQADMETALGTRANINGCNSFDVGARCNFGNFYCSAYSIGIVNCNSSVSYATCEVDSNGVAACYFG